MSNKRFDTPICSPIQVHKIPLYYHLPSLTKGQESKPSQIKKDWHQALMLQI